MLCVALTAVSCTASTKTSRSTTTSAPVRTTTTSTPLSTTTSTPRPTVPAGGPVPGGFEPGSVTFVLPSTGFVIGIDSSCAAGTCVALARTTDGGSSWVALSAPVASYVNHFGTTSSAPPVSEVRFADELDGWIYGPSLFATHDGGATWQQVNLGGSVISLETSGRYVDAVVSPCAGEQECSGPLQLEQALATGGPFTTVLTGPSVESAAGTSLHLSLHAPVGFVNMSGVGGPNQAFVYATQNLAEPTGWKVFPDPCAVSSGYFVVGFVAPDTTHLDTLCHGQGAAGSVVKQVVRTENGRSIAVGTPPPAGDPEELAATATGALAVSAASGASWLYRSSDGGSSWTTAETYSDGGIGFNDLGFTTSTEGVVIHGQPGPPTDFASQLLMTHDSGASWTSVAIG
jgi:hypothetical protein